VGPGMNAACECVEARDGLAQRVGGSGKLCDRSRFDSLCLMEDRGTDFRIVGESVSRVVARLWQLGERS
jgi:hypothetical protein